MALDRFDTFTRALGSPGSRRSLGGAVVSGVLSALLLKQPAAAPAQTAEPRTTTRARCPEERRCPTRCCPQGRVCRNGRCRPKDGTTPAPEPTQWVRQNLKDLPADGAVMQAYARGVGVMKSRPISDPTSWAAQARIHANRCQHGSYHFLAWHRMYLYWFERILRDASGDQRFALPYWDYSEAAQQRLPAPFRARGSNLFDATRRNAVNNGQPGNLATFDADIAMRQTVFSSDTDGVPSFAGGSSGSPGELEFSPHNGVHLWVGGHMSRVPDAGKDPIFWAHHCNIDRLWETWLRQGEGRANLSGGPFLRTTFSFWDERGREVQMTGADILDTVEQLDYRYAGMSDSDLETQRSGGTLVATASEATLLGQASGGPLTLGPERATVKIAPRGAGRPGGTSGRRFSVTFKGVTGTDINDVAYHVHVDPKGGRLTTDDASYVGTVGFFGLRPSDHPGHPAHSTNMSFDIPRAVGGASGGSVTIVLVPFEVEPVTEAGAWGAIEAIELSAFSVTKRQRKRPARRKTRRAAGPTAKQRAATRRQQRPRREQQSNATPDKSATVPATTELGIIPGNKSSLTAADLAAAEGAAAHRH